jgi:hypothetical protein
MPGLLKIQKKVCPSSDKAGGLGGVSQQEQGFSDAFWEEYSFPTGMDRRTFQF